MKTRKPKTESKRPWALTVLFAMALPLSLSATPMTISQKVEADTYVSSGDPTVNFGTKGGMEIAAPTIAQSRTQETLSRFNTAAIVAAFNTNYGSGAWTITSVTLSLSSNYSTAGVQPNNSSFNKIAAGGFEFDWLSNDAWSETAITWNTLSSVLPGTGTNALASLGSFYWSADGSATQNWTLDLASNLVTDINNGGEVSILGQPTTNSTIGYLFNTLNNGPAYLNVTADVVPEPSTSFMALAGAGMMGALRFRKKA